MSSGMTWEEVVFGQTEVMRKEDGEDDGAKSGEDRRKSA